MSDTAHKNFTKTTAFLRFQISCITKEIFPLPTRNSPTPIMLQIKFNSQQKTFAHLELPKISKLCSQKDRHEWRAIKFHFLVHILGSGGLHILVYRPKEIQLAIYPKMQITKTEVSWLGLYFAKSFSKLTIMLLHQTCKVFPLGPCCVLIMSYCPISFFEGEGRGRGRGKGNTVNVSMYLFLGIIQYLV